MLKLLSKSEIDAAKNLDRSREIAEGLKISKRVDGLRELVSKEEKALSDFRIQSLAATQEEISALVSHKEKLVLEMDELRRELKDETSLSREERKNLEVLKKNLEKNEEILKQQSEALALEEIDIAIAIKDAKDALARASTHEDNVRNLNRQSENDRIEARQILSRAQNIEENALQTKAEAEGAISLREKSVASRENALVVSEQEMIAEKQEMAKEKIRLADQRKTLERALERIKNNRL